MHFTRAAVLAISLALLAGPAAGDLSWDPGNDGSGGSGDWNTGDLFWDETSPPLLGNVNVAWPLVGDDAVFATGSGIVTINEGMAIIVNTITFDSLGGAYTINATGAGDSLNLTGGITANTTATINAKVKVSTVTGNFTIGGGGAMKFGKIDPGADDRAIDVENETEVSRFTDNKSNVVFGGAGTMTLTGTDSDFANNVYIRDSLTVVLAGAGPDMLARPVYLINSSTLKLGADDQLGTYNIHVDDSSILDVNGKNETVGRVYLMTPADFDNSDARIELHDGDLTITTLDANGGATIETGTSGILTLTDGNQHFNRGGDTAAVTIGASGTVVHDGNCTWNTDDSHADIDLQVDAKIMGDRISGADGVLKFGGWGTVLLTNPSNEFNMRVDGSKVLLGVAGAEGAGSEIEMTSGRLGAATGITRDLAQNIRLTGNGGFTGGGDLTVTGRINIGETDRYINFDNTVPVTITGEIANFDNVIIPIIAFSGNNTVVLTNPANEYNMRLSGAKVLLGAIGAEGVGEIEMSSGRLGAATGSVLAPLAKDIRLTGSNGGFTGDADLTVTGRINMGGADRTLYFDNTVPVTLDGRIKNFDDATVHTLSFRGSGGTVVLTDSTNDFNLKVDGATVLLGADGAQGAGEIEMRSGRLGAAGGPLTIGNNIRVTDNQSGFIGSETLNLTGSVNTGTGGRTLTLGNTGLVTLSGAIGNFDNPNITTLVFDGTGSLTVSGADNNTSRIRWNSTGTLTLSKTLATTVVAGELTVDDGEVHAPTGLTINQSLVVNDGLVVLGDAQTLGNDLRVYGGSVTVGGAQIVANYCQVSNDASLIVDGLQTIGQDLNVNNDAVVTVNGAQEVGRNLSVNNAASLTVDNVQTVGQHLYFNSTDSLIVTGMQQIIRNANINHGAATINNQTIGEHLNVNNDAEVTVNGAQGVGGNFNFNSTGSLIVDGTQNITGYANINNGTVTVNIQTIGQQLDVRNAASLTVDNVQTVGQHLNFDSTGLLTVNGSQQITRYANINKGTLRVNSGGELISLERVEIRNSAQAVLDGGEIDAPLVQINSGASLSGYGTVVGQAELRRDTIVTATGGTLSFDDLRINPSGTGTHTFTGSGQLIVTGELNNQSSGNTVTLNGTGLVTASGPITGSELIFAGSGDLTASGTDPNTASIVWGSTGDLMFAKTPATVAAANQLTVNSGAVATTGDQKVSANVIVNGGQLDTGPDTLSAGGTMTVGASGTLTINAGGVSVGSFYTSASSVLDFTDAALEINGGTFGPGAADYSVNGTETASLTLLSNATATVDGTLSVEGTGVMTVNDGQVTANTLALSGGTFTEASGSVITVNTLGGTALPDAVSFNGAFQIGHAGGSGTGSHTVGLGQSLTIGQNLVVATNAAGLLRIVDGGEVNVVGTMSVGTLGTVELVDGEIVAGNMSVSGSNTFDMTAGTVQVNGSLTTNSLSVFNMADGELDAGQTTLGSNSDTTLDDGDVEVSGLSLGAGSRLHLGDGSGDDGSVIVTGHMNVGLGIVNFNDGLLTVGSAAKNAGGQFNWLGSGTLTITSADLFVDAGGGEGHFLGGSAVIPTGATLAVYEKVFVGDSAVHDGSLTLAAGASVNSNDELKIGSRGEVVLEGAQAVAPSVRIDSGGSLSGHGIVTGKISTSSGSTITADGGTLTLGDSGQFGAFNHQGELHVAAAAVIIETKGFAGLGSLTTLAGGTLTADNGIGLGAGDNLAGWGSVDARISAGFGSTIEATGDLVLGDANAYDGFFSDGQLVSGAHTVTIYDADEAVLGSLTQLGDGVNGGTLTAGNTTLAYPDYHFLLEQGKNMVGRGWVNGDYKNHGHVIGEGTAPPQRIIFESGWTVTGKGRFEYVGFKGTFAPGDSPTITSTTHAWYAGGTVQVELGGTTPGSGNHNHDQINDTATVWLDLLEPPTLEILPWNNFVPEIGDEFVIMTWQTSLDGEFGAVIVDPWFTDRGIDFELHYNDVASAGNLTIEAVPEPATLSLLALGGLAVIRRKRRQA